MLSSSLYQLASRFGGGDVSSAESDGGFPSSPEEDVCRGISIAFKSRYTSKLSRNGTDYFGFSRIIFENLSRFSPSLIARCIFL